MAWPEVVTMLDASDIHRGDMDGPCGTHCLLGCCIKTFGPCDFYGNGKASRRPPDVFLRHLSKIISDNAIALFNDKPTNSKQAIADAWNAAYRKLGYTVPCER